MLKQQQLKPQKAEAGARNRAPHSPTQDSEYMDGEPRPHHHFYVAGGDLVLQVRVILEKFAFL
jgi:hypothetical protein